MKLHTETFLASQDDYTKMSDAYKCRNVVSVLDLLSCYKLSVTAYI